MIIDSIIAVSMHPPFSVGYVGEQLNIIDQSHCHRKEIILAHVADCCLKSDLLAQHTSMVLHFQLVLLPLDQCGTKLYGNLIALHFANFFEPLKQRNSHCCTMWHYPIVKMWKSL